MAADNIIQSAGQHMRQYEDAYKHLHSIAELSWQEEDTAAFVKEQLDQINADSKGKMFDITTGIGGTGLVGVMHNGAGRTVLLRAELDALPLEEETNLPYSSHRHGRNDMAKVPVMHACAHDMHMAALLCAARALAKHQDLWSGVLVVLFQPSEENGLGAQAMVDAGLYDPQKFGVPIPHAVLAGHTMPIRAGRIASRVGVVNSAVQSLQITIYGRGGHGARPHNTVDPVVVMSSIIMKLQTIVSRETAPQESVVVTVGSAHAGSAENIISDRAVMKLGMRALSTEALKRTHAAVIRIVEGECHTFQCPKAPEFVSIGSFPLLQNHPRLTKSILRAFDSHFGQDFYEEPSASMGAEDLANLAVRDAECCFWNIGAIDQKVWDEAEANDTLDTIAGNHSSKFAPAVQPTLQIGVEAFIIATLDAFNNSSEDRE